ncbi:MAG TPA: hypothetical protein VM553_07665 [Dongiaceae bacterium]|nr:hypothetical protein [Dongiaceae bacterium]
MIKARLLASILAASSVLPLTVQAANSVCNPLSIATCALPFPSDYWSEASSASPTGRVINISDDVLRPEVFAQLPAVDGFTPQQVFDGTHGFSAASAVVFEFVHRPDITSLPVDGGSAVLAFDLTSGEAVEIRTQLSAFARGRNVSAPSEVLEIYPRGRWSFGHRILIAVTKDLSVPGETADFTDLRAQFPEGSPQSEYLAELTQALTSFNLDTANIRNATLFTVRDQNEVVEPMRRLVNQTFANEHPIRNLQTTYLRYGANKIARVTGELRTDNYRTNNGIGAVDFNATPKEQWIPFRLTLPKASRTQGRVPVAFYAHGLGGDKESDFTVSGMNAELGVATFSVDFPNHGARSGADGGQVFNILNIAQLATVIGMMTQDTFDFAAAHKALRGLADLDVVRNRASLTGCWQCPDGIPDIDPTNVFMEGTSLGGVLGSSYATLSPDLKGALFHVTGVGITSILSNSALWDGVFSQLEPPAANGAEALMLRGAVQQALDYGDSINYIDLMRSPANGQGPRPLLVITGKGDAIVPNNGSIALARILDMPLVGRKYYEMPGVITADDYDANGYGIRQYPPLTQDFKFILGSFLTNASAHGIFLWPNARRHQQEWIERFVLE